MPRIQISNELYAKLAGEAKYRGMSLEEFLLWLYCGAVYADVADLQLDRGLVDSVSLFVRERPELGYQNVEEFVRDSVRQFLFSRGPCRTRI